MEVLLYVYDLSNGLARQASAAFLGTQIDAVYHTSVIYGGVEYFYGRGIQMSTPGQTHHGQPMEVINLGVSHLPQEVVQEYLGSLKDVYSAESYDLFLHNCNNFSNDFSMFLVGKGIPDHITSLPQTVLNTPFGQMLRPTLDRAMRPVTQAPVVPYPSQAPLPSVSSASHLSQNGVKPEGTVKYPKSLRELNTLLESAEKTCAAIFFTSSTCGPCKVVYPTYDSLAAEAGPKATLIKVDINQVYDIAQEYRISATPTFITYLKGEKENEWKGANPAQLTGNIRLLIQMAFPAHPHSDLYLPTFKKLNHNPVIYSKVPPIDKLLSKLGTIAKDTSVQGLAAYLRNRAAAGSREAPLPDLKSFSTFLKSEYPKIPQDSAFAVIDLLRASFADPRVSGYYAAESDHHTILGVFNSLNESSPYSLRLVTLQAACNLFSTPLYTSQILTHADLTTSVLELVTTGLLDVEKDNIRAAAASLAFNVCTTVYIRRDTSPDAQNLSEADQVVIAASMVEAIGREESNSDILKLLLSSLGLLVFCSEKDGELSDVLSALEAKAVVQKKVEMKDLKSLASDVVKLM